jgi:hypothetical protein
MRSYCLSGKTVLATILVELLLIFLASYWYSGSPGWGHGDEGRPSVTIHFQVTPRPVPLTRSYPT